MILNVNGPSLIDFKEILSVSFSQVSNIAPFISLGYCIGALVSGFAFQFLNRQLLVIIFMAITAIVCAIMPFTPSLAVFLILGIVFSYGNGTLDAAQNTWFIEMWQERSNSVLQLAQFMFGLGTIVTPIIEGPYLTGETNATDSNSTNSSVTPHDRRMLLAKPYALIGAIQLSSVLLLALMFCYKKYEPPEVQNEQVEKKLFEDAPKSLRILMILLISLCLGYHLSVETSHFAYIVSFAQYIPLKMTPKDAALLQGLTAASYTTMRAAGALIALWLSPRQMMFINYSVILGSCITLLFAINSWDLFWALNILLGTGFATMWGSIFSFADKYFVFDNLAGSLLVTTSGGASMISLFIIGKMIDSNPIILIYFHLINASISITFFVISNLIIMFWSKKTNFNIKNLRKELAFSSLGGAVTFKARL